MGSESWFYWRHDSLFIHVYLQPQASADSIIGVHAECLKIKITAQAIEGKANSHLIKFIAHHFKVPKERVIILHGEHSRKKWIQIKQPSNLTILKKYSNENSASK